MKREPSGRIPTDTPSVPLSNPFASLELDAPPPPEEFVDSHAPSTRDQTSPALKKNGSVLLRRETAHRHGGVVIVLTDFSRPHNAKELDLLARDLKKNCGTGGTVKNGRIEIQGEMSERIKARLDSLGYRARGGG